MITVPVAVTTTAPAAGVTSTSEDKRLSQIEKEQPQNTSNIVTETENLVTKTLPPKSEKSEPTPPLSTKKDINNSEETKPSIKVSFLRA